MSEHEGTFSYKLVGTNGYEAEGEGHTVNPMTYMLLMMLLENPKTLEDIQSLLDGVVNLCHTLGMVPTVSQESTFPPTTGQYVTKVEVRHKRLEDGKYGR